MSARYILRLDDIAPNMNWTAFAELRAAADTHDVRPLLGVIPDNQDPTLLSQPDCPSDFWEEMRALQARGWGISMHGYQHVYATEAAGLLGRLPKSEFAGRPYEAQREMLSKGKLLLEGHGLRVACFMAPSHSFDEDTIRALLDVGIDWMTDGLGLFPYRWRGMNFMPQILTGPKKLPVGLHTICIHLNTISQKKMKRLLAFLRANAPDFVSFDEAKAIRPWLPGNRLLGMLMERVAHRGRRSAA